MTVTVTVRNGTLINTPGVEEEVPLLGLVGFVSDIGGDDAILVVAAITGMTGIVGGGTEAAVKYIGCVTVVVTIGSIGRFGIFPVPTGGTGETIVGEAPVWIGGAAIVIGGGPVSEGGGGSEATTGIDGAEPAVSRGVTEAAVAGTIGGSTVAAGRSIVLIELGPTIGAVPTTVPMPFAVGNIPEKTPTSIVLNGTWGARAAIGLFMARASMQAIRRASAAPDLKAIMIKLKLNKTGLKLQSCEKIGAASEKRRK